MKLEIERICIVGYVTKAIDPKNGVMEMLFKPCVFESVKNLADWK